MSTNIETLQAQKAQEARLAERQSAVRSCLAVLAPENGDATRSYAELVQRLQTVLSAELPAQGE